MADVQNINFKTAIGHAQEADRKLDGYRPDVNDGVQRRAILNKEKTKDNLTVILRDCMDKEPGTRNQTNDLKQYYKERFGKDPRKDATVTSIFLGMPKNYLPADFHLTDPEYHALCDELANHPITDHKALASAHKKVLSRDFSDSEKEQIYEFIEKSVKAICKVFGVKEEDVLYCIGHLDESFPHIHCAILPAMYIKDQEAWNAYQDLEVKGKRPKSLLGDTNREIQPDEKPVGCSCERFNKKFLHELNKNFEAAFAEQGITVKLANGKGQINNVQNTGKEQRKQAQIARVAEEESKRRKHDMDQEFDQEYEKRMGILDGLKNDINTARSDLKGLNKEITESQSLLSRIKSEIRSAKKELSDLRDQIKNQIDDLVKSGIRMIKKAVSRKDKEKAADESINNLLRIKTDATLTLPGLDLLDDDDEPTIDTNTDIDMAAEEKA